MMIFISSSFPLWFEFHLICTPTLSMGIGPFAQTVMDANGNYSSTDKGSRNARLGLGEQMHNITIKF
jgi:hypothetical protein